MATGVETGLTFEERRLVERFQALLVSVREQATEAPDGTVIDCIEASFLDRGRELLRHSVEVEVQYQADLAEKKGRRTVRPASPSDETKAQTNATSSRR